MDTCDVLVVGGGPGGSSCAWKLKKSGLDVVVIDKASFPRDKTCAGWVTPEVFTALQIDLDGYSRNRVLQPITGFRTAVMDADQVETSYGKTISYGIRRCEFDQYLLERADARCWLGQAVRTIERNNGDWVVNDRIRAPLIVGAGGHFCPVARELGARQDHRAQVVAAQEIEFPVSNSQAQAIQVAMDVPELYFCRDLAGYGWCFRKGNYLNIGLGRLDRRGLTSHVAEFCQFLAERRKVGCEIPSRFHGHAYQIYERVQPKLTAEGALLVGDAAGLAYSPSGEGIRPAVESGLIAAQVILASQNDYSPATLVQYEARIRARLGRPRSNGLAQWLPAAWSNFLAHHLMTSRWFARHVIIKRWFLHSSQAALAT
jgi:geranylgeranyl reductase family protein